MSAATAAVDLLILKNVVPVQTCGRGNLLQLQLKTAFHSGEGQFFLIFFRGEIPEPLILAGRLQQGAGVRHRLQKCIQQFIFQCKIPDIRAVPVVVVLILTDENDIRGRLVSSKASS